MYFAIIHHDSDMLIKHISWIISKDGQPLKFIKGNLEISEDTLQFSPVSKLKSNKSFQVLKSEIESIQLSRMYYKPNDPTKSIANIAGIEIKLIPSQNIQLTVSEIKLLAQGNWIQRIFPKSMQDLHDFERTKYINHLLKEELGFELKEEEKRIFHLFQKYDVSPQKLHELRRLFESNPKIRLDMIQSFLNLEKPIFDRLILLWVTQFNLKIEGEYIISEKREIGDFLNQLDKEFNEWNASSNKIENKIE